MAEEFENQGHNRICMLEDVVATISVRDEKEQRPLRSLLRTAMANRRIDPHEQPGVSDPRGSHVERYRSAAFGTIRRLWMVDVEK